MLRSSLMVHSRWRSTARAGKATGAGLAGGPSFRGQLRSRLPWIVWGLIIQALGAGSVAVVMWHNVRNQSFGGHMTAEMMKLAWRAELHSRAGLVVLAAGSVVYAVGTVVMARPFVSRPALLFIAIPIAAVAGLLVVGVLAFVVSLLIGSLELGDIFDLDAGDGLRGGKRRRRR